MADVFTTSGLSQNTSVTNLTTKWIAGITPKSTNGYRLVRPLGTGSIATKSVSAGDKYDSMFNGGDTLWDIVGDTNNFGGDSDPTLPDDPDIPPLPPINGYNGIDGLNGSDGQKGDTGDTGEKGDTGEAGTGAQGPEGPAGEGGDIYVKCEVSAIPSETVPSYTLTCDEDTTYIELYSSTEDYPLNKKVKNATGNVYQCIKVDSTTLRNTGHSLSESTWWESVDSITISKVWGVDWNSDYELHNFLPIRPVGTKVLAFQVDGEYYLKEYLIHVGASSVRTLDEENDADGNPMLIADVEAAEDLFSLYEVTATPIFPTAANTTGSPYYTLEPIGGGASIQVNNIWGYTDSIFNFQPVIEIGAYVRVFTYGGSYYILGTFLPVGGADERNIITVDGITKAVFV